jgi:hypothetical protein
MFGGGIHFIIKCLDATMWEVIDTANYLGQNSLVCSATRGKKQKLPKDTTIKILEVFKNPFSKVYLKFL